MIKNSSNSNASKAANSSKGNKPISLGSTENISKKGIKQGIKHGVAGRVINATEHNARMGMSQN